MKREFELKIGQLVTISPHSYFLFKGPNSYSYVPHRLDEWLPYLKEHDLTLVFVKQYGDDDVCLVQKKETALEEEIKAT